MAGGQTAPESQPTLQDVTVRDNLIANQESLLNTYRCQFNIDTQIVPGGCTNGQPTRGHTTPGTFQGAPTQQDLAVRDNLIANQESLLNTYRCQFNIDTQIVPGGCPTQTGQPAQPEPTGPTQTGQPTQPDSTGPTQSDPPGQFTAISTGHDHACGIRTDKTVACWGQYAYPDAVPDGQFTAIAAGRGWTCGIRTDKTLQCWGWGYSRSGEADEAFRRSNEFRQGRGLDPYTYAVVPQGHFTAIDAGIDEICGIKTDNSALCWGDLLGDDHMDAPDGKFTAISTGSGAACGIRPDKTIQCWGNNSGRGIDVLNSIRGQFTSILVESDISACGMRTDGYLVCWGQLVLGSPPDFGESPIALAYGYSNFCGIRADKTAACGEPGITISDAPDITHHFQAPKGQFTAISPGANLVCAIRIDKTVACWGPLWIGEADSPVGPFTAISPGVRHSCAIRADNTIECWGLNTDGQANVPKGRFTAISAGSLHSCAIRTDSTIICWGSNTQGQTNAPAGQYTAISASSLHSCAIRTDSTIICWGDNKYGQADPPAGQFTAITGANTPSISTSAHTCAIRTDNTIECWGSNEHGQANAPADKFTAISTGGFHTCGIRTDNTAVCWGSNTQRQSDAPAGQFTAITTGALHSCAIRTDNTAVCWGDNKFGQADPPAGQFTAVKTFAHYSCAIRTDQTAVCWGRGTQGQSDAHPPAGTFTAITTGTYHSCGVRTDQAAVCWQNWATSPPDGVEWVLPGSEDLGEILAAEAEMARLVNELRQGLGLAPLNYSAGVASVARRWSQTMRDTGQFVHNPIYTLQYPPGATLGRENIATVSGTTLLEAVQIAFDGLVASPGHYANMTSTDINTLGVGIAFENNTLWLTQNFAHYS